MWHLDPGDRVDGRVGDRDPELDDPAREAGGPETGADDPIGGDRIDSDAAVHLVGAAVDHPGRVVDSGGEDPLEAALCSGDCAEIDRDRGEHDEHEHHRRHEDQRRRPLSGPERLGVTVSVHRVSPPLRRRSRCASRGGRRPVRCGLELPVIAEQLGILIDSGTSLPAAITRIGQRGRGAAADDLVRIARRIRSGASETAALTEWAERTDVDAVRRLVSVLSLHREAGDLGRLISEESRAIRAETHRELVERIERRGQLVWIPVTVATLVPGLLFLAVPFVSALTQVTGT